jgi:phosphoenolpyruvate synthase/pyruvate phosphate dikinase
MQIIDKNIADQTRGIFRKEGGGSEWRDVPSTQGSAQVLSDAEILELSTLILKIEEHYGFPCDIEWAREVYPTSEDGRACPNAEGGRGGKFYIVQSRPITTLTSALDVHTEAQKSAAEKQPPRPLTVFGHRDFTLGLLEVGLDAESLPLLHLDGRQQVRPYFVATRDNDKDILWLDLAQVDIQKQQIFARTERDATYIDWLLDSTEKACEPILDLLYSPRALTLEELRIFAVQLKLAWRWYAGLWWAIERLEGEQNYKEMVAKTMSFREKTDKFVPGADAVIRMSLTALYPSLEKYTEVMLLSEVLVGNVPNLSVLEERNNGCILIEGNVYTGEGITNILGTYNIALVDHAVEEGDRKKFTGQTAYAGIYTGIVTKVITKQDARAFVKGHVMVSSSTTPDLMHAIQDAGAIIADEGGIISHAAIVSRELHIPCIIGTKIATQVLHDGDLVEVDAERGVVTMLERASETHMPIFQKNDFVFQFESRGTSFLFEDIVALHYLKWESVTVYRDQCKRVYVTRHAATRMNNEGAQRTCADTEQVVATLKGVLSDASALLATIKRDRLLTQDVVREALLLLDRICDNYSYFDIFYSDGLYAQGTADAQENVKRVEAYKNALRTDLDAPFFTPDGLLNTLTALLGAQYGISVDDLLWYRQQELLELFNGTVVADSILAQRRIAYAYYIHADLSTTLFVGDEALALAEQFEVSQEDIQVIRGTTAHGKGNIIRGRVRIIRRDYSDPHRTRASMDAMHGGDILVSENTDPELMDGLKKAGAIVTDVGGMLSHAAITARELDTPCIVGTEYASKILHDGDLVEVDADNGVVRLVRRNEIEEGFASRNELEAAVVEGPQSSLHSVDTYSKLVDEFQNENEYYMQEFVGYPFATVVAWSGITMERELGYAYTKLIYRFGGAAGVMGYTKDDLSRIYTLVMENVSKNSNYLAGLEARYHKTVNGHQETFLKIDTGLESATDGELLNVLKDVWQALTDSVGVAHILESVGQCIEQDLRDELSACGVTEDALPNLVRVLSSPAAYSWLQKEERELRAVGALPEGEQHEALIEHYRKWFWINTNYAGRGKLTIDDFIDRMNEQRLNGVPTDDLTAIQNEKTTLLKQFATDQRINKLVSIIEHTVMWQDDRKANVYKAVDHAFRVFEEIERRLALDVGILSYMTTADVERLADLSDIRTLIPQLEIRKEGVYILQEAGGETVLAGADVATIDALRVNHKTGQEQVSEFSGSSAFRGRVTGTVRLCMSIESVKNFPEGYVLVTSMTRPEFVPAVKNAVAIITDEGGITCHAAIVARELKKPCIIGTNIATHVLHDGDLVEVDADNGVVRVIRRAESEAVAELADSAAETVHMADTAQELEQTFEVIPSTEPTPEPTPETIVTDVPVPQLTPADEASEEDVVTAPSIEAIPSQTELTEIFHHDSPLILAELTSYGETLTEIPWSAKTFDYIPYCLFERKAGQLYYYYDQQGIDWKIAEAGLCDKEVVKSKAITHFEAIENILKEERALDRDEFAAFIEKVWAGWTWWECLSWMIEYYDHHALPLDDLLEVRKRIGCLVPELSVTIRNSVIKMFPDLMRYADVLLLDEVMTPSIPSNNVLEYRLIGYAYTQGKLYDALDMAMSTYGLTIHENASTLVQNELVGRIVHSGKARGCVKILTKRTDMFDLHEGDILVAFTATSEYLPAMKRASAIISEYGGVICHAAIAALELDVPCIVGVKGATLHLHNGDLVEVDADTGTVRVIERV